MGMYDVDAAVNNVWVTPRGKLKLSAFMERKYRRRSHDCRISSALSQGVLDMDFSGRIVNLVDESLDLAPGLIAPPLFSS